MAFGLAQEAFVVVVCFLLVKDSYSARIRQEAVRKFPFRLQPELDVIDIDAFVRKDWVLKFHLKCLLNNDTFCDAAGRWLAPRIPFILLEGKCPKCTAIQEEKIARGLSYVRRERPEIYKALMEHYIIEDDGVGSDSVTRDNPTTTTTTSTSGNEITGTSSFTGDIFPAVTVAANTTPL